MESSSSSNGPLPKRGQFDVNLNMGDVTVVSSYDEDSKWVDSSAISLPPDVHTERIEKLRKLEQKQQEQQRRNSSGRFRRKSSSRRSSSSSEDDTRQSPTANKDAVLKPITKVDPLRHFNLLALSQVFFLIGSSLFIAASWLEIHERSNNDRTSTFTDQLEPDEITPTGYHLKLSTSIDTYITRQMICMLGASFCFLQVGFINVVRTPLDKFHFFQILAGFFGLLSSMFWETKTILSDISYFFFVHAMTGQSLLLLHYHMRKFVTPTLADLKIEKQERKRRRAGNQPQRQYTFSPIKEQQGHFAFESSQEDLHESPSGLMSDDGVASLDIEENYPPETKSQSSDEEYSFSIENSFSLDQDSYPGRLSEGKVDPQPEHSESQESDATSLRRNMESKDDDDATTEETTILLKFGSLLGIADSLFVLGSLIETALTYLTILVLPTQEDEDDTWNSIARGFNLVPGILWLLCAIVTLLTSMWMRRRTMTVPPPMQARRPSRAIAH